ncbi:Fe(3+)-hydroxamate ABC transporter permease FhuB [Rhizobium sp. SYY.PMSO]|uniref:Fe(3+)-hydroxamate ABC transporter permease FhuB n=1 Tax=Rhizobium sp. SYY.PMSO TaxID=3382192 RepID=UPI003990273C
MTEQTEQRHEARSRAVVLLLFAMASVATAYNLNNELPLQSWFKTIANGSADSLAQVVFLYSLLPRVVTSLLCGAALGISGATLQQILQNPLAEPTTLGVSAGAQLALSIVTIWFPSLLVWGTETIALVGAAVATLLVLFLAFDRRFLPIRLILSGLVVSLYAGTLIAVIAALHGDDMGAVLLWSSGVLNQNGWDGVRQLIPQVGACTIAILLLARPLSIATLGDERALALGVPIGFIRISALIPAIALGASVISAVGVIGFVGIGAPALARGAGNRRMHGLIISSALLGALLLWSSDQFVIVIGAFGTMLPTGAVTALLGAPVLLWLMGKSYGNIYSLESESNERKRHPRMLFVGMFILTALALLLAMAVSNSGRRWSVDAWTTMEMMWALRLPRIIAAGSAGAMLAMAGSILQRVSGNPMASPEVMGISSAASLGAVFFLMFVGDPSRLGILTASSSSAALALLLMLVITFRNGAASERLLLVGMSIASSTSAATALLLASGNPRLSQALALLSGSTYRVTNIDAGMAFFFLLASGIVLFHLTRWLTILPLGQAVSVGLGISIRPARIFLIIIAAICTGAATLVVGPLSFAGLLAPHLARRIGLARAGHQLIGAAIIGSLILIVADWLGRNLLFPYQIPAGLLGSLVGGPYLLVAVYRGTRSR